jgi:hypothetical protein
MTQIDLALDPATIQLLRQLARAYFDGDEARTIKAALQSLAAHTGCDGWAVSGYAPLGLRPEQGRIGPDGRSWEVSFRPIFGRQSGSAREP